MTRLIRWNEGLWALLVLLAAAVMACGLADSFSFLVRPPTYVEGHRLVLLGALAFAASSAWAVFPSQRSSRRHSPQSWSAGWRSSCRDGILPNIAGLVLIPMALAAMLFEIPAETYKPEVDG